jgi:hypothetical protein
MVRRMFCGVGEAPASASPPGCCSVQWSASTRRTGICSSSPVRPRACSAWPRRCPSFAIRPPAPAGARRRWRRRADNGARRPAARPERRTLLRWDPAPVVGLLHGGVMLGALWWRRERAARTPLIDVSYLLRPEVGWPYAMTFLTAFHVPDSLPRLRFTVGRDPARVEPGLVRFRLRLEQPDRRLVRPPTGRRQRAGHRGPARGTVAWPRADLRARIRVDHPRLRRVRLRPCHRAHLARFRLDGTRPSRSLRRSCSCCGRCRPPSPASRSGCPW